jgi:hypothetical protein
MSDVAPWTAQASHEDFVEDCRPVACGPVVFKRRVQCIVANVEGYDFIMYVESLERHSLAIKTKDGLLDCRAFMGRSLATHRTWFFSVTPEVELQNNNPVLLLLAP